MLVFARDCNRKNKCSSITGFPNIAAPDPQKKGLVKLCRKSLTPLEFGQLQSDRSILFISDGSIKGCAKYFHQFDR